MLKFPEDLRVYEHLLWQTAPSTVIEVGVKDGGSALWFRDRLRTLAAYGRVRDPLMVAIDVEMADAAARRKTHTRLEPHTIAFHKRNGGGARIANLRDKLSHLIQRGFWQTVDLQPFQRL